MMNDLSASTPTSIAIRAWRTSIRYSPWIGTKCFGWRMLRRSFSSSWLAWPETCGRDAASYTTSAPSLKRLSTVRLTSSSLPGIGFEDMTTVSPSFTATCRLSPRVMRARADLGARGVGQQQQRALRGDRGQAGEVRLAAVDRRMVELPVAGVDDRALGGLDGDPDGVGDAVADVVRIAPERADAERLAGLDLD